jgi:hypothetical protein
MNAVIFAMFRPDPVVRQGIAARLLPIGIASCQHTGKHESCKNPKTPDPIRRIKSNLPHMNSG